MFAPDTLHEGYNAKRRKLDQLTSDGTLWDFNLDAKVLKKLTYDAYTVGWICALPLELVAARSMLDEEHETLDLPFRDHNTYCLGAIGGHNVVLCSLPVGEYGITSATKVASNMIQTFPNSKILSLLVGIGGGVPSVDHDIRLGDIAVSISRAGNPAVKQYDYGKTVANGYSVSQGSLNKPAPTLLTAVAKVIAEHKLGKSQISRLMAEAIRKHSLDGHEYPGIEFDTTPEYHCAQSVKGSKCGICGLAKTTSRAARISTDPVVHYGTIGSGNQGNSCTRDRLAKQHDIICFEMEAAGLMDDMQCLVIRGICDYCDAQKAKVFQDYSALAAAAYTKELLLTISPRYDQLAVNAPKTICQEVPDHRRTMMEALDFDEAESRRATIKRAHSQTCKWVLTQQEYLDWLDVEKLPQHNGLFWIRGKAGCGKSTLMKYLVDNMESLGRQKLSNTIVISFFFNARGGELERSTVGMYRSLLYQLLKKIPESKYLLDKVSRISNLDSIEYLQHLFEEALQELQELSIFCFVDALDECPEDQIQDMVTSFESLGDSAIRNKSRWRICFSSRYYPNISTQACISLELDKRDGHADDIKKYINMELKAGTGSSAEALKAEIAEKSGRIFLWVVLVVRILKKLFNRGRGSRIKEMRSKLKEIPLELDQLFHDILTRDNNNIGELVLTIQWLLYSQRPLKREELYFAIQSGDGDAELESWDTERISASCMDNYILDCSKGLVELTRSKSPSAQFIHESVREFLLKPGALENLWPESGAISEGKSHHRLFECCWRYMKFWDTDKPDLPEGHHKSESSVKFRQETLRKFPFLAYATRNLLYHADYAAKAQLLELSFCRVLDVKRYISLYDALARYMTEQCKEKNFLLFLKVKHLYSLLPLWIRVCPSMTHDLYELIYKLAELGEQELYKKVFSDHIDQSMSDQQDVEELKMALFYLLNRFRNDRHLYPYETILSKEPIAKFLVTPLVPLEGVSKQTILNQVLCLAALVKDKNAVKCLLNAGAQPNSINGSALQFATEFPTAAKREGSTRYINQNPHILVQAASLMRELVQKGAKLADGPRAITESVRWADATVARIIWDEVDANLLNTIGIFDLMSTAAASGNLRIIPFLLEKGADLNSSNDDGLNLFDRAVRDRYDHDVIEWLVQHGARPAISTSPLSYVIKRYRNLAAVTELSRALLVDQSFVNQADENGKTPLIIAVEKNYLPIVRMLLEHGADGSQADEDGKTPLIIAVEENYLPIVRILLEHGADGNQADPSGWTPLTIAILQKQDDIVKLLQDHDQ